MDIYYAEFFSHTMGKYRLAFWFLTESNRHCDLKDD